MPMCYIATVMSWHALILVYLVKGFQSTADSGDSLWQVFAGVEIFQEHYSGTSEESFQISHFVKKSSSWWLKNYNTVIEKGPEMCPLLENCPGFLV